MIQFNLLPAVKLDYVQARRNKRAVIVISGLVTVISLAILILLFMGVQVFQKKHSSDLSKDIKRESAALEGREDINKILTIQNQLNSLTDLHNKKPVTTRLFDYVKQLTPAKVSIAALDVDFDAQTMEFTGSADAISSVNRFADTLKFTTFKAGEAEEALAFNSVVLAQFGKDTKGSSYKLTLKYDPKIFSSESDVKLSVPAGKITTRSQTEKPDSLFQPLSNPAIPGVQ